MKTFLLAMAMIATAGESALAQTTRYWDRNGGATAGAGAIPNGTWITGGGGWNTGAGGSSGAATWANGNIARFSAGMDATGAFTVTVSDTVNVNQIIVEEGDPTFTGGIINFNHSAGATSLLTGILGGEANVTVTMHSQLSGTNGFRMSRSTVAGNQILNLNNTANNWTGGLTLNSGQVIKLGAAGVIPDTNVVTFSHADPNPGATLDLNNFDETVASISQSSGTASNIELGSATLTLAAPTGETYSGVISGTGNLVIDGPGSLTLTNAANTYSGGTAIIDGTLYANNTSGSATGTGAVMVHNGGTLAGTGAVTGAVTVDSGATVAPGSSIGTLATGTITLAAGASLAVELNPSVTPAADLLTVAGSFSPAGATLDLTLVNAPLTLAAPLTFLIVSNDGIDAISGTFASIVGLPPNYTASLNYAYAGIDALGRIGTGNDLAVTLAAVPEAPAWMMLTVVSFGIVGYTLWMKKHRWPKAFGGR